MATVWEIVYGNSPLGPGHTFWEHLNAQEGGGQTLLIDALQLELAEMDYDIEIEEPVLDVELEKQEFELEIDTQEFEIEID